MNNSHQTIEQVTEAVSFDGSDAQNQPLFTQPDATDTNTGPPITGIFPSLKWRILSMAALSIFSLLGYLGVLYYQTGKSADLLSDIQDKIYPVQEHMLAATHALEFINRELEVAAITGDEDAIESTLPLADTYRYELGKVALIEPDHKEEIQKLSDKFEDYYVNAKILATEMVNSDTDLFMLRTKGRQTAAKYTDLMRISNRYQDERKEDLKSSIASSTAFASQMLEVLLWTGLVAVAVVLYGAIRTAGLISSRIKEIVSILKNIALDENDLSARISLTGRDEMTELGYWFNSFIAKLEVITENSTNEILYMANTDFLSGLANRRSLLDSIETLISNDVKRNQRFTLFFIDLDDFKPVNDKMGHEAGDQLIQQVARRLDVLCFDLLSKDESSVSGTGDNMPMGEASAIAVASRIGGDEFVLLVTRLNSVHQIDEFARLLISTIASPYSLGAGDCTIGTSVGVAQYPWDGENTDTLMDCADKAVYEAKSRGKNQHVIFATELKAGLQKVGLRQ